MNLAEKLTQIMNLAQLSVESAIEVFEKSDGADGIVERKLCQIKELTKDVLERIRSHPNKFGKLER